MQLICSSRRKKKNTARPIGNSINLFWPKGEKKKTNRARPIRNAKKTKQKANTPPKTHRKWGKNPKSKQTTQDPLEMARKHTRKQMLQDPSQHRNIIPPPSSKPRCKTDQEQFFKSRKQHLTLTGSPKPPPIILTLTVGAKEL